MHDSLISGSSLGALGARCSKSTNIQYNFNTKCILASILVFNYTHNNLHIMPMHVYTIKIT